MKCNPFEFRDEESFFEAFLHELEKAEGLMEEMQVIGQEERSRIMRKGSVAEEDGLDLSGKIRKILTAIENEDEVEKSKIAKVFKEKTGLLTLGIKKGTLNKLLKGQNKSGMSFQISLTSKGVRSQVYEIFKHIKYLIPNTSKE